MKIACFDVATVDYYPQQKKYYLGGNSLNQVVRHSDLGHETAFVGAVGNDAYGNQIIRLLQNKKVDISHMTQMEGSTAYNKIINDDTGERFGVEGAWRNGVYGEFKMSDEDWQFLQSFDVWITHGNYSDLDLSLKKKSDQIFCVDFLDLNDPNLLRKCLDIVDIAFIGGTPEMEDFLFELSANTKTIIVLTLGAKGSMAFSQSNKFVQEALPVNKVMDTTGCGDAFQAGFISSYIADKNIEKALLSGATLGKLVAEYYGGCPYL